MQVLCSAQCVVHISKRFFHQVYANSDLGCSSDRVQDWNLSISIPDTGL